MAESGFDADIERVRLAAARRLPASCQDDFQRLSRTLVYGPAFQWLLIDAPDEGLRKQVMAVLDEVLRAAGLSSNRLPLSDKIADVAMLEGRLLNNAAKAAVVHVMGRPGWFTAARWDAFNVRRERLAAEARARLVFWLDADAIELASRGAPDLWAWRGGVYTFTSNSAALQMPSLRVEASGSPGNAMLFTPQTNGPDNRSREERLQRIAEIRQWLATVPAPPDELLAAPVDELGRLLYQLGDFDAALQQFRTVALPLHERLGDVREKAVIQGRIADILLVRGQLDEALRIHQEEVLPVYEHLDDARSKAVTLGKIADILQARGQLDEALRIRQEELLPVFEHLGDARSMAVTLGTIADILQVRGQLDEALRIYKEQLPVFERLNEIHDKTVTLGRIANILQARGQLDEALHIYQKEQLPVHERLGDMRAKAVTMGKIAAILQARGQLNEALALHEQLLPVVEHMGFAEGVAHAHFSIASLQLARGDDQRGGLKTILGHLEAAFASSLASQRTEAVANIGKQLAQVLVMDNQTARALEVLNHAEAAYKTLGQQQGMEQVQALKQQIGQPSPPTST